jgi:polyhydroxybutyrate depolymerase
MPNSMEAMKAPHEGGSDAVFAIATSKPDGKGKPANLSPMLLTASLVASLLSAGGVQRSYYAYVPPKPTAHPALVLVLHGGGATSQGQARYDRFADVVGNDAIVVYPQGIDRHWNDARDAYAGVDDTAFLSTLIRKMESRYAIDPRRVYVAGISNGGMMALTAACVIPGIAAVAAVSANLPAPLQNACKPKDPVAVMLIDGTADPLVPYGGGMVRVLGEPKGEVLAAAQTIGLFRQIDACTQTFTVATTPKADDGTKTVFQTWPGCARATAVELASVQGGGHAWPGRSQYLPRALIGIASQSFDATKTIWKFFLAHPSRN